MLTLPELSLWQAVLLLVGVAGAVSWGLTQILKLALSGYLRTHPGHAPWFWDMALRAISMAAGAVTGFAMMRDVVGLGLGTGAGALNTIIVWALKRRAKKLAGDDSPTDPPNDPTVPPDPTVKP